MNSKRKDLQYASVFLLAVALTFLMGKGDNLWLISWGDLIPVCLCCSLRVIVCTVPCSVLNVARKQEVPVGVPALLF